jgi:hypothetical protein
LPQGKQDDAVSTLPDGCSHSGEPVKPTAENRAGAIMQLGESEYFQQRLDEQIEWYDRKSMSSQRAFKRLRLVEILAAATIPVLAGFGQGSQSFALATGLAGMLVTVIAGILALYRFQENWREYRATAEALKQEKFLYLSRARPYQGEQRFETLVQRVETLLSRETTEWTEAMRMAQASEQAVNREPATNTAGENERT